MEKRCDEAQKTVDRVSERGGKIEYKNLAGPGFGLLSAYCVTFTAWEEAALTYIHIGIILICRYYEGAWRSWWEKRVIISANDYF